MTDTPGDAALRFRKKPVVIEAMLFTHLNANEVATWCGGRLVWWPDPKQEQDGVAIEIPTLEGTMRGDTGHWIIKGIKGEFYPCKPDIFEATYEPEANTRHTPEAAPQSGAPDAPPVHCPACSGWLPWDIKTKRHDPCPGIQAAPPALTPEEIEAIENFDWGQPVGRDWNPCFHIEGRRCCGRAKRWAGHERGHDHAHVSLLQFILARPKAAQGEGAES